MLITNFIMVPILQKWWMVYKNDLYGRPYIICHEIFLNGTIFFCIGNRPNISFWMAPVYFYIEQRFSRRTFNTLIKLIMTTVYPLSRSPYISLLDCYIPFIVRKPLARYPGMEIEPIVSGSAIFRALDLGSLFFQQQWWIPLPPTTRAPPAHRTPSLIMNELKAN